jgi:hypothetical protein
MRNRLHQQQECALLNKLGENMSSCRNRENQEQEHTEPGTGIYIQKQIELETVTLHTVASNRNRQNKE